MLVDLFEFRWNCTYRILSVYSWTWLSIVADTQIHGNCGFYLSRRTLNMFFDLWRQLEKGQFRSSTFIEWFPFRINAYRRLLKVVSKIARHHLHTQHNQSRLHCDGAIEWSVPLMNGNVNSLLLRFKNMIISCGREVLKKPVGPARKCKPIEQRFRWNTQNAHETNAKCLMWLW